MKRLLSILLFSALLAPAFPAAAQPDLIPCDDLASIANDLTVIANEMEDGVEIEEGDELDQGLDELVDVVYDIADAVPEDELSSSLYDAGDRLNVAWDEMDRDAFVDALDELVDDFDFIEDTQCDYDGGYEGDEY